MTRIIVVGGGVAGLVVAHRVAAAGADVLVLEAGSTLGGQLGRHEVAGLTLDSGAEAFATRGDAIPALLAELGLAERVVRPAASPAWLMGETGDAHPLPAASVLGIPGVPLARDVASVVGWGAAARAALDPLIPPVVGARSATVGELVRRRLGAGVLDRLVAPVVEGVHSRHPDQVPVAALGDVTTYLKRGLNLTAAVRRVRESAPAGALVASLDGGLWQLVDALADRIRSAGGRIETDARANVLDAATVAVGDRHETGRVVIAAPGLEVPGATASAPAATRTHLVTLALDAPALATAPRGTGALVAHGAPVRARALTHLTAKWPWLRGRAGATELVRLSYADEPDLPQALADAAAILGVPLEAGQVVDSATVSWSRAGRAEPHPSIPTVGEHVAGTGLAAVIAHSERIAKEITP